MEQLGIAIENFINSQILPLAAILIFAAFVIVGLFVVAGPHHMLDKAKERLYYIVGGAVLIYFGANIAQGLITSLGYTGGF